MMRMRRSVVLALMVIAVAVLGGCAQRGTAADSKKSDEATGSAAAAAPSTKTQSATPTVLDFEAMPVTTSAERAGLELVASDTVRNDTGTTVAKGQPFLIGYNVAVVDDTGTFYGIFVLNGKIRGGSKPFVDVPDLFGVADGAEYYQKSTVKAEGAQQEDAVRILMDAVSRQTGRKVIGAIGGFVFIFPVQAKPTSGAPPGYPVVEIPGRDLELYGDYIFRGLW
jgi:hypothetical protein